MMQHVLIKLCKLMGVSYIVYCSGHFSKKAAKIVLRLTAVIALGPKKNNSGELNWVLNYC